MRMLVLLLLSMIVLPARAQSSYSLPSPTALAGEPVWLRIDDPSGCHRAPEIDVARLPGKVEVKAHFTDAGTCLPEWATPRFVALGAFDPGAYIVEVQHCANVPPPFPECEFNTVLTLTVFGVSGARYTVPSQTSATAILLALLVAVGGVVLLRRSA
jgi:hypothetical protein